MPYAGNTDVVQLDLDVYGADTAAYLTVTDGDNVAAAPVLATPTDGTRHSHRALVDYTTPGVWELTWNVTGTGAGRRSFQVQVAPTGASADLRPTYATTRQLAEYLHDVPPLDAGRMLRRATAKIDDLLICAVYPVNDTTGLTTDPDVAAALTEATCALVEWWMSTGDDGTGSQQAVTSASVAGVSLGWARGADTPDRYGEEVRGILNRAGLLGYGPIVGW